MARVRTDIIVGYLFRRAARRIELLQLRRATEPMKGTWQPVMGHARRAESAVACMWREVREETGLTRRSPHVLGAWALEGVHPYFIARLDAVILSPCFAVEVSHTWKPVLNGEHNDRRWVEARRPERFFTWPSQVASIHEITTSLLRRGSLNKDSLAIRA